MKKKVNSFIIIVFILLCFGCSFNSKKEDEKLSVVTTIFPAYDFARAVIGKSDNITLLLSPGSELHTYEPTPKDIMAIKNCDVFIYNGGESDEWVEDILDSVDLSDKIVVKMMDAVKLYEEESSEGMEIDDKNSETEYDEHIWTSPLNAIKIINFINDELGRFDSNKKDVYKNNTNNYTELLSDADIRIRNIVNNSKRKTLIFGDRFPLRYFVEEYNLNYYAAFPGCSSKSEPSTKTISYLISKIKDDKIPIVLYLEISNKNISNTLSEATGAKTMEFSSIHNITKQDFNNNLTYVDIMNRNIQVLEEALN